MDFLENPVEFLSITTSLLLLLLCAYRALDVPSGNDFDAESDSGLQEIREYSQGSSLDLDSVSRSTLHYFQLWTSVNDLDDELGYWVKPRSTTWFSRFLVEHYDDDRWVKMFRLTKPAVFSLAELLKPHIRKKHTKYRLAIPAIVRVACTLFKLTHGASLLICSELFAVGRSSVSMLLREVVFAINVVLRSEIAWPSGQRLRQTEADFHNLSGLPGVVGAIDGTHVAIVKPKYGPADYFYFKSGGYTVNCQVVVDSKKRFLDLFWSMPGSTNDSRVLRRSSLFRKGSDNSLWDPVPTFQGFSPYLVGDAGYPLLPWLLVPHRESGNLPLADALFNRRLRKARGVVENAFALLKQTFRELLVKTDLDVTFVPDVITCCALLHNMLLRQSQEEVERLQLVLRTEGFSDDMPEVELPQADPHECVADDHGLQLGIMKRRDLGLHLAVQRMVPI